jgi:hypothetical protein
MIHTNFLAVFLAGVAAEIVGLLWYGPLFGKPWAQMMGFKLGEAKNKNMTTSYVVNFIAALVMAYVLSNSFAARPLLDLGGALWVASWIWIGFIATVMLSSVLWDGKPIKLYWINSLFYLVVLWAMTLVLMWWR